MPNFHSVDICRLIKNNIKKNQGGKLIQTLILSKLPNLFQRFLEEGIWFMLWNSLYTKEHNIKQTLGSCR